MRALIDSRRGRSKPRITLPSSPSISNSGSPHRLTPRGRTPTRHGSWNLDLPALEKTIEEMPIDNVEFYGTCSVFLAARWQDVSGASAVATQGEVTRVQWIEYWGRPERLSKAIGETVAEKLFDHYVCDERQRARGRIHTNDLEKLSKLVQRCWRDLSAKGATYLASFSWWEEQLEIEARRPSPRRPSPSSKEPRERPAKERDASADRQRKLDELCTQLQRTRAAYETEIAGLKQQLEEQKERARVAHECPDESCSANIILKLREQVNLLEEELETARVSVHQTREFKDLQARIVELQNRVMTLESEKRDFDEAVRARDILSEQVTKLRAENARLEKELDQVNTYFFEKEVQPRASETRRRVETLPSLTIDVSNDSIPALVNTWSTTSSSPHSPGSPKSQRSVLFPERGQIRRHGSETSTPVLEMESDLTIPEYHIVGSDGDRNSDIDYESDNSQVEVKVDESVVDTTSWTSADFIHELGVALDASQRGKENAQVSKILTILERAREQLDIEFDINCRLQKHRSRKRWIVSEKDRFDTIFVLIVGTGNYQLVRECLSFPELDVNLYGSKYSPLARAMISRDVRLVKILLDSQEHRFDLSCGYISKIGGARAERHCAEYAVELGLSEMSALLLQYGDRYNE